MSWHGEHVYFVGDQEKSANESNTTLTWRIYDLEIPVALQDKKEEVKQLIREALDAQGWLYTKWVRRGDRRVDVMVYVYFDSSN